MNESERVSQLIGDIYDASLDPTQWPFVLENYANFIGGVASALFVKDSVRKTHNVAHTWGYNPEFARLYVEKYVRLDPFTTGQFFFDIEQPMCLADIMTHAEFRKSRFYEEWVRPQHWVDAIGVTLEKSATTYSVISVIRHRDHGIADEPTLRRAKLIAPHVRRAVLIGRAIDLNKVEAAALADTLDGLAAAVFLVDASGRLMHANAAGHVMLGESSVVQTVGGKIAALDAKADRALREILISAVSGDAAVGTKGIAVPISARDGERFVAHFLPLTSGSRRRAEAAYSAVAAIFVRKAALEAPHPIEAIAVTYRLTPAEMRVLMMIVEVGGVPEVASVLGISETTVKTHLQHIFGKTGAARQADLVKLVVSHMGPLNK